MEPHKKIPSFCFESPWLKPFIILESVEVTAQPRRLRATWTPELAQDLDTFHGLNIEDEIVQMLSRELTRGIDINIMNNLIDVNPLTEPSGRFFYFDFDYGETEQPFTYDDGSWSFGNTFEGVIGIKSKIKPHKFV